MPGPNPSQAPLVTEMPGDTGGYFGLYFEIFFIQIDTLRCLSSDRIVNGNQQTEWCEALYQSKGSELLLYGRALGLTHTEAEDVLQETFVALMQRVSPPSQPEHYCIRTFRNRALNYRRSLWRRLTRELESHRWFEASTSVSAGEFAAMKCLEALPQEQREVIVLKIWHQYTFEEIGELTDISPNTIAGRYRYGLQKIKARLKGTTYEQFETTGDALAFVGATPPFSEA